MQSAGSYKEAFEKTLSENIVSGVYFVGARPGSVPPHPPLGSNTPMGGYLQGDQAYAPGDARVPKYLGQRKKVKSRKHKGKKSGTKYVEVYPIVMRRNLVTASAFPNFEKSWNLISEVTESTRLTCVIRSSEPSILPTIAILVEKCGMPIDEMDGGHVMFAGSDSDISGVLEKVADLVGTSMGREVCAFIGEVDEQAET